MSNVPSPFGLPLEAGPLQGINLGDPLNVTGIGGSLSAYSVNPPNPQPLFDSYSILVHDELGILRITGIGTINKNDKYGQAVQGPFNRVIKSLDGQYGANLILRKSSSIWNIWNRDGDSLWALKNGDRLLVKHYSLEGHDPLSKIYVEAKALSPDESYLTVTYQATSFESAINECPKKANAAHRRTQKPEEDKQKTRKYDPVRADTFDERDADPKAEDKSLLFHEQQVQTSTPPSKPSSEASSSPKIRPPGTMGLPNAYERPLKREVSLDLSADADLPDRFIAALGELIREMKASGAGQKRYELKKGLRTETAGDDIHYRFPFTDKIEREDQVEIQVDQRRVEGTIVSIGTGYLILALKEDIGDEVRSAMLMIYKTALLEALKEKIEAVNKGEISLNRTLADAVVQPGALPNRPVHPIQANGDSELDDSQCAAYYTALREAVTFIWGPPGCGKTMTLSAIVHSAFNSGKRTLICSNTNKAVDQVLYKICEALTHEHPAMEGGKVVRLGRIADDKLESKYGKYVAIDEIAERRSAKLAGKKRQLEEEIARIDAYIAYMQQSKQQRDELSAEIRQIETEIAALRKDVAIDKIVERRLVELAGEKRQLKEEIAQIDAYIQKLKEQYATACQRFKQARQTHDDRRSAKAGEDRTSVQASIDKAKQQRDELSAEIRQIEIEIAALRKTVLRDAKIVGATCTTAYLTGEIGQFDLVIVDEASMVIRPTVWFSAGLASERVVISGDFRQIPSIVTTEQEAIFQELGLDSFTATERTKPDAPGLTMLTTQYRMHPEICELISGPMYEDKLRTSPTRKKVPGRLPPNPFEKPLTIIDTSDLGPVESSDKGSRFNKLHALLVRNFVWHLRQNGVIETNHDLGICTPYSAQSHLIQKLLKEDGPDNLVHCGTVHRFQGDERRIVLLEIPESSGRRALGQFVQGVPPDHIGARLINVAVSRAQEHFVVLANLTHLDKRLPSHSLLRSILHKMEQQGRVVPGGELDKLRPIGSGPTDLPPASPSKPPSEPPSHPQDPVEHSRSTNPPTGVAPSPFGLPLEAGPLQGIELGDPLNVIGGILSQYRVDPPNPYPLFAGYSVYVHDELGILRGFNS